MSLSLINIDTRFFKGCLESGFFFSFSKKIGRLGDGQRNILLGYLNQEKKKNFYKV